MNRRAMHQSVSAEQYDAWTEEQCAGIEIVDGMVLVRSPASKWHNRLARPGRSTGLHLRPGSGDGAYWDNDVFTGPVKVAVPFALEIDLGAV